MLYFAYGSNMDPKQMRRRCPSHRFVTIARLPDHKLVFPRRSAKRRCGVAGFQPCEAADVWGIVYDVSHPYEIITLDAAEGYLLGRLRGNAYQREQRTVIPGGTALRPLSVEVYVANIEKKPPPPSKAYLNHMLRGARHWGLPTPYIEAIEKIEPLPGHLA